MTSQSISRARRERGRGEAFYKSLYERSPRPCVIFDSLNHIEDMNNSAFELLGGESNFIGSDISMIFKKECRLRKDACIGR